jgi:prepilin-type N-terminal cleavage/methylation domain-containing protein/prepilin-type processing-associated H-X9-DG protein
MLFRLLERPLHSKVRIISMRNDAAYAKHDPNAFTLLELIVVVAIIGLLVSLFLPAVQSSREASRRQVCQSNLKQIALALLSYETIHEELPVGARSQFNTGQASATPGVSWWAEILPDLEESMLFAQLDRRGPNCGLVLSHLRNARVIDGVVLASTICPSSRIPTLWPVGDVRVSMPSYVGIAGAADDSHFSELRNSACCAQKVDGLISAGGLLVSNRPIALREVLDGLSNCLLVAESSDYAVDVNGVEQRVDGGFNYGWIMGTKAPGTPPDYGAAGLAPSWNITTIRYGVNDRNYNLNGVYNIRGVNNPVLSAHPSGATAAFADGSVHFLGEDVELAEFKRLATRDDGSLSLSP